MHMHTIAKHMPPGHAVLPDCKCSVLSQGQLLNCSKPEEASAKALYLWNCRPKFQVLLSADRVSLQVPNRSRSDGT